MDCRAICRLLGIAALLVSPIQHACAATPVSFEVDGSQQFAVSRYVYGSNQADWQGKTYNLTLTRWGGNRTTAYNWENNASNAGSDWHHQNDALLDQGDVPGNPVRKLVGTAFENKAAVVVTVPISL